MVHISVKCVLWDYGNTLLLDPFSEILAEISSECVSILEKHGYKVPEKDFIREWTEANGVINYPHISHFLQEEPVINHALLKLGVLPKDMIVIAPEILGKYRGGFESHARNDVRNKEVAEIVSWIKHRGFRQGIFSNGRIMDPGPAIALMRLEKYFDIISSSEEEGIEKPDPAIFDSILKSLNMKPGDCVYIGDDPLRDIECAKKKGMSAILYKRPKEESAQWRDYKIRAKIAADAEINFLAELKNILVLKR